MTEKPPNPILLSPPLAASSPEAGEFTLRDLFAAFALAGWVAGPDPAHVGIEPLAAAQQSYKLADAMLAERERDRREEGCRWMRR